MKKFAITLIVVVIISFVVAVISQCTNGFTNSPKSFAILYDGNRILNDKSNVQLSVGDTLEIRHYGDDSKIDVAITPLKVNGDYMFEIDGREYSWNNDVVSSKNASKYLTVSVAIDQAKNTVKIVKGFRDMLQAYATGEGVEGEVKLINPLPQEDMFIVAVTTGESTIKLSGMLYSAVSEISLNAKGVIF